MNGIANVCATVPQETLSSLATSLIEITGGIEVKVDDIRGKLLSPRPCDETNQPVINCLEDSLRFLRNRLETISKDVYNINDRL